MLKNDIVLALAEMDYYKNQSGTVINDVFRVIAEALARGEKVTIRGFGSFEVKTRKGCLVRDIHTKEQKQLEDYRVVVFRPGESLKEAVREEDPEKFAFLFVRTRQKKSEKLCSLLLTYSLKCGIV